MVGMSASGEADRIQSSLRKKQTQRRHKAGFGALGSKTIKDKVRI